MKRNHTTEILVREEGITGLNLQRLKLDHSEWVTIRDFTAHEESATTGADWEWWFVDSDTKEAVGFAVQAKRLTNSSYSVDYKPKKNPHQIETLLRYCSRFGDITPLYCWYNYFPHQNREGDSWGCALADGYSVYAKYLAKKCSLTDIQPISVPWHQLVCGFDDRGIQHIHEVAKKLKSKGDDISLIALPDGVKEISTAVQENGLPDRVLKMLNSKGERNRLIQKDPPVAYPRRLVIIESQWHRSTRSID